MDQDTWNGKTDNARSANEKQDSRTDSQTVQGDAFARTRVLLVEDESLIAELICEAFEEHGFCVHSVSNAADALNHLSGGGEVDVLFTDINLPGELDGAALAAKARCMKPDLPVIYASGRWGLLEELRRLPLSKTLQKPYSTARACAAVEGLMSDRIAMLQRAAASQQVMAS